MGITEQDLQEYVIARGQKIKENGSIWAVNMPSVIDMVVFGPVSNLFALRYNILNIIENGIFIIGVDEMGNLTPLYIFIPKDQIKNINVKKKSFSYKIEIITENSTLRYHINKIMIGSNFHKKNFSNVIQELKKYI